MQSRSQRKYNSEDIEIYRYGLEGLYLTFTKVVVITILAILLGIFKEYMLFTIFYIPIRMFSFGWHANSSKGCWVVSTLAFLTLPFLSKFICVDLTYKVLILTICFVFYLLYSPADTKKRPIINHKRRITYKILTLLVFFVYCFFIITYNSYITNIMIVAIIYQVFLISPIAYGFSNQPYANYKAYL